MRSALLAPLLPIVLLLASASSAWASEWAEGDYYRFRLPADFEEVDLGDLVGTEEAKRSLSMLDGFFGDHANAEFRFYTRETGGEVDAYLGVVVIRFEGKVGEMVEEQLGDLDRLEAELRKALDQVKRSGQSIEDGQVSRTIVGAGQSAVELMVTAESPELGEVAIARMLFLVDENVVIMVAFQGRARNVTTDTAIWRAITASLQLDGRSAFVRLLFRYGPFALGALVLLLAFHFLRNSGTSRRDAGAWGSGGTMATSSAPSASSVPTGGGRSRPSDGLPVYGGGPLGDGELPLSPSLAPLATGAPRRPGIPSELPPRIPRAPVRAGPPPLPATEVPAYAVGPRAGLRLPGTAPAPADPPTSWPVAAAPSVPPRRPLPDSRGSGLPSDLPTNVARREAPPPLPVDLPPLPVDLPPVPVVPPDLPESIRPKKPPAPTAEELKNSRGGLKIQRNSDYLDEGL